MWSWKKRKNLNFCFMLSILRQTYKAISQCSPQVPTEEVGQKWRSTRHSKQNNQKKEIVNCLLSNKVQARLDIISHHSAQPATFCPFPDPQLWAVLSWHKYRWNLYDLFTHKQQGFEKPPPLQTGLSLTADANDTKRMELDFWLSHSVNTTQCKPFIIFK